MVLDKKTNELTSLLREKNIFNIADVEFAILENEGKLSVLPKLQKQPLTPSDLNITTTYKGLTADVIIDGNIMKENLRSANQNEEWLMNKLNAQGVVNVQDVKSFCHAHGNISLFHCGIAL